MYTFGRPIFVGPRWVSHDQAVAEQRNLRDVGIGGQRRPSIRCDFIAPRGLPSDIAKTRAGIVDAETGLHSSSNDGPVISISSSCTGFFRHGFRPRISTRDVIASSFPTSSRFPLPTWLPCRTHSDASEAPFRSCSRKTIPFRPGYRGHNPIPGRQIPAPGHSV